jgi:hypothetical protein
VASDEAVVKADLPLVYRLAQALLIGSFWLLPASGWAHVGWQVAAGWAGGAFVLVGVRRARLADALPWYLLAGGVLINSSGILVEEILERYFHITTSPTLADAFFFGLYPPLIASLAVLVYRRSAGQVFESLMPSTLMSAVFTMGLGLFAWEFIAWQPSGGHAITLLKRIVVTAYPLADLTVVAFMLRLIFGGGARTPASALIVAAVTGLLGADIVWAVFLRSGVEPEPGTRRLLETLAMAAFALVGTAALHPSMPDVAPRVQRDAVAARSTGPAWATIAVSGLAAPAVLLVEALLDTLYHVNGP